MSRTDRVFGCECSTEQVYEEGAKEVALSAISGINCKHYKFLVLGNYLMIPFIITDSFSYLSSEYLCIWANEQREDVHDDRNYPVCSFRYIRLYRKGNEQEQSETGLPESDFLLLLVLIVDIS